MARNGSGVYSLPAGSTVTDGDSILATQHNTPLLDLQSDANTARPIVAGGTGATTASGARTALGLGGMATQAASSVAITGGTVDGVAIGGSSAGAGAFTTVGTSGAATLASAVVSGTLAAGATTITGDVTASGEVGGATAAITGSATAASFAATGALTGASMAATGAITAATVTATGTITAADFAGDGSALTGIPDGTLTYFRSALIDGSTPNFDVTDVGDSAGAMLFLQCRTSNAYSLNMWVSNDNGSTWLEQTAVLTSVAPNAAWAHFDFATGNFEVSGTTTTFTTSNINAFRLGRSSGGATVFFAASARLDGGRVF